MSAKETPQSVPVYEVYDTEEPLITKDGKQEAHTAPGSAMRSAYFNTVCMMMGVGVLGLPATVAKAGWIMLAVIPVLIVMACYSARLLIDGLYSTVKKTGEKLDGYPELGWHVMGWFGLGATHFAMKMTLLTVSGVMCFLGSTLARTAIIDIGYGHDGPPADLDQDRLLKNAIIVFCCAALLPTLLLPTLREVSFMSLFGAFATISVAIVVIVVGIADSGTHGKHTVIHASKLGDGFGTIVLGLGGAATMPAIERQMSATIGEGQGNPRRYKNVLVAVFASLALVYMPVAFTGYYVYGEDVAGLVLESLPTHGAYLAVLSILNVALAIHCFITHSLIIFVLSEELERRVFAIEPSQMTWKEHVASSHTLPRLAARVVFVAWTFCIAYFVPNFLALCDMTGSFCAFTVYVLPGVFTLALDWQREKGEPGLGWPRRIWIVIVICVSLVGFFFGFKSAVKEIHDAFNK
eukprot:TRINITY_DN361_c0_g1_i2.p1 TRINITY_DN361_c0_g1~~TRINITY_DN361_c0_g1_i2.p1  ORF type:complete len:465 (+),score=187.96 TRINITY_DN361_c0_g1_i2:65-1459(+)